MKNVINFKKALEELEEISRKMEDDNLDLDESIELVKRAKELAKMCKHKLNSAQLVIEELVKDDETSLSEEIFKELTTENESSQTKTP